MNAITSKYKVCIALLTKNVQLFVASVLQNVTAYAQCFNDYECLIVDGYSTDSTASICAAWCRDKPTKRKFVRQPTAHLPRMVSLTEARNFVIDYFRPQFGKNTLLLLIDADSPNATPITDDLEGFMYAFRYVDDWSAVFANQPTVYYDAWALRDVTCPIDYQLATDMQVAAAKAQQRKDPELGLWPVVSAFGGAGLYKTSCIPKKAKYSHTVFYTNQNGTITQCNQCEHVAFNSAIVQAGGRLFVNCKWLIGDHEQLKDEQLLH